MLKRLRAIRFGVWITSIGLAIGVGIAFFLAALSTFTKVMAALFAASMSTLVLAVLFAERQSYAAALKDSRDQLQSALEHQRVLLAELDHRVKNVLATVSAVASQTKDASGSTDDFVIALDSRIRSMATAHELLSVLQWRGIPMAALVTGELAPFATRGNVEIDGPETMLLPSAGQAMAMVVHELVTNAAKYGALSTPSGRVSVRWKRRANESPRFVLVWKETGGPRVETPKRSGYGIAIIRNLIPYELHGTVDISFAPEGFQCRLEAPFSHISAETGNGSGSERFHTPIRSAIR